MIKLLPILQEIKIDTSYKLDKLTPLILSRMKKGVEISAGDINRYVVIDNYPKYELITLQRIGNNPNPPSNPPFNITYEDIVEERI